ncbi:MAG: hypothetical protein ACRDCE_01470 [Cetobacterium sp.]
MKSSLINRFITDHPTMNNTEVASALGLSRPTVIKARSINTDSLPMNIDWDEYQELDVSINAKIVYFYLVSSFSEWYCTKSTQQIADGLSSTYPTIQKAIRELQVAQLITRRPQLTDGKQRISTNGNGSYHYYLPCRLSSEQSYELQWDRQEVSEKYRDAQSHRKVKGAKKVWSKRQV